MIKKITTKLLQITKNLLQIYRKFYSNILTAKKNPPFFAAIFYYILTIHFTTFYYNITTSYYPLLQIYYFTAFLLQVTAESRHSVVVSESQC